MDNSTSSTNNLKPRNCILGCPQREDLTMHSFPTNTKRRAQWLQIIGIETNLKQIYLCDNHFSEGQIFGKKTHKFAVPDRNLPPKFEYLQSPKASKSLESQSSNTDVNEQQKKKTRIRSKYKCPISSSNSTPNVLKKVAAKISTKKQINTSPGTVTSKLHEISDPLYIQETQYVVEEVSSSDETIADVKADVEPCTKSEDFEIRHRFSNDVILKGRYVQSEDNSIMSFTIPNSFSLDEQVDNLLVKSEKLKSELQILKTKRLNLSKQLKKHKDIYLKIKKKLKNRTKFKLARQSPWYNLVNASN